LVQIERTPTWVGVRWETFVFPDVSTLSHALKI
jgi:hypothetical protein